MVFNNSPRVVWSGSGAAGGCQKEPQCLPPPPVRTRTRDNGCSLLREHRGRARGVPGRERSHSTPNKEATASASFRLCSASRGKNTRPPPTALAQRRHLTEFDTRKYDKLINPQKNLLFTAFSNQRAEMENTVSTDG